MSNIHFIGGEKGGVGKSFTARALAQFYIDQKCPFSGFDTDQSHQTFSRFYGEFTYPVRTAGEGLDEVLEHFYDNPDSDTIVDLAAQTASNLFEWMESCDFFELMDENNTQVFYWHVLDDGADCKNLLQANLERLQGLPCKLVVVKNEGCGSNFGPLEASPTYKQALSSGASVITLPQIPTNINQKIDFENLSFWAACNDIHSLSRVERQRINTWTTKVYKQIQGIELEESNFVDNEMQQLNPA